MTGKATDTRTSLGMDRHVLEKLDVLKLFFNVSTRAEVISRLADHAPDMSGDDGHTRYLWESEKRERRDIELDDELVQRLNQLKNHFGRNVSLETVVKSMLQEWSADLSEDEEDKRKVSVSLSGPPRLNYP